MDIQTVFYTLGTIIMILILIMLIALVVLAFYIQRKINQLQKDIEEKFNFIKGLTSHPTSVARTLSMAIAELGLRKFSRSRDR